MTRAIRAWLVRVAAALLARTWRLRVSGDEGVRRLRARGVPLVFAVWHGHLLAPLWHRRREGIMLIVSEHRDAADLARAAAAWGYRVVRGSSTRGAVRSLRFAVRSLRDGDDIALTPDGPRGPVGVAKGGTVAAARLANAVVVPVGAAASRAWHLRSWDGLCIPMPFARVRVVYGPPWQPPVGPEAARALADALNAADRAAAC